MSSEPEKDIEKQIRSYAERRREAAGERFTMHPASRQALQGEVAEAYPPEKAESTPITVLHANEAIGFWTLFRRQLAMFGSLAAILLAVGLVWLKYGKGDQTDLAMAETDAAAPDVEGSVSTPLELVDLGVQSEPGTETAAIPAAPPTATGMAAGESVVPAAVEPATEPASAVTLPVVATIPAPAPAPAPSAISRASDASSPPAVTPDPNRPAQRFVSATSGRILRRNLNSPPPVEILKSFQVQQVGRQLLLVDADGSTYAGEITVPENDDEPLIFRVRGSSRSLNQAVSIQGRLSPVGPGASPSVSASNLRVSSEATLPLNRLRIEGRATIGTDNQIPIRALPSE